MANQLVAPAYMISEAFVVHGFPGQGSQQRGVDPDQDPQGLAALSGQILTGRVPPGHRPSAEQRDEQLLPDLA